MKFKIAVPTNDKINLFESIEASEFFKIITVDNRKIIKEDYLQNNTDNNFKHPEEVCDCLSECNYILTSGCSEELKKLLEEREKVLVPTSEKIVSNAVNCFINDLFRKDSDRCCCP